MNIATFSGNLTKECRVNKTGSGTTVASFTIAVNSGFGDKQHTDFVECSLWGKRAEGGLIQYLTKGQQVLVLGEVQLKSREYEGKTYTNMNLSVDKLDLIGGRSDNQQQPPAQQQQQGGGAAGFDDDIPFAPISAKIW